VTTETPLKPTCPLPPPRVARYLRAALWLIAAVAIVGLTIYYDRELDALYDRYTLENPFLDGAALFVTMLFAFPTLALGALLLKILDRRLRWRFYFEYGAVMATQMLGSTILKQLIGRPRPSVCDGNPFLFHGPNLHEWAGSMPSGHGTASFAWAVVMSAYYPRWRVVFYGVAAIIPFCRVQSNRHFISDVVAGAFLGYAIGTWTLAYVRRRWPERKPQANPTMPEPADA
jgi:undecaprenyl-diphosphatase